MYVIYPREYLVYMYVCICVYVYRTEETEVLNSVLRDTMLSDPAVQNWLNQTQQTAIPQGSDTGGPAGGLKSLDTSLTDVVERANALAAASRTNTLTERLDLSLNDLNNLSVTSQGFGRGGTEA